jgi:type I restriction-modification system DNA methylase subunit
MPQSDSLKSLADSLVDKIKKLLNIAKTEEELKIGVEKILEPIKEKLKIKSIPRYEKVVYSGRSDAVHGQVIIEYKPPKSFDLKKNVSDAYEKLKKYLSAEAEKTEANKLIGVGFDGYRIFFVKWKQNNWIKEPEFDTYDFDTRTAETFLIHLRGLSRLPFTAENLAQKFGPTSELTQEIIQAMIDALKNWGNRIRIQTFFNEWKRLFGIVYGERFTSETQKREEETLSKIYNYSLSKEVNFQEFLFCIHTYFALLMKLISIEILTLKDTSFNSSFALQLAHAPNDEIKNKLEDIENGGIFNRKGITNFLEGDFFRWYLDAFDSPALKENIKELARALSEFEPATSILDPVQTRDLLKKLYQYLVPREVRQRLGEYYTPDWLAELLLEEVRYDGNTLKRLLDPACGSGTFLVLAIQKAIDKGKKEKLPLIEIAKRIKYNIWGFDLNPLAVIAARTNYLFAMGELVNEILDAGGTIEIPIYLCDSILTPKQIIFQDYYEISTSVGRFQIPQSWMENRGFVLMKALPIIEEMVKSQSSVEQAMERLKGEGLVSPYDEKVVKNFYSRILDLEMQNKNGIWTRFLKNAFAPIFAGKFDFVIGNPPWIMWEFLSKEYRAATQKLWEEYGLTKIGKLQNALIRGRRDLSMLFVYTSADYYLKDGGKLGFLITQEVFKSKGGEAFRSFEFKPRATSQILKVLKVHDFVRVQPFEDATNKTAMLILKKGEKTKFPVPYIVWNKKKSIGKIPADKTLSEVSHLLQKKEYYAIPLGSKTGPWQIRKGKDTEKLPIEGKNEYKAYRGAAVDPYGVFWLEVKQVKSDGTLIISNLADHGKRKVRKLEFVIEKYLVYPGIRGSDIERWYTNPKIHVLITHPASQKPYSEEEMKRKWPRTFNYLIQFKDILVKRGVYKHFHEKSGNPFYGQRNFSQYTFANFKVVWKRMSNDIFAAVVSMVRTPYGYKKVIPLDTTSFFATDNELEAHYLCSIINSKQVRDFIKSFSSAGRGFGAPSVMDHIGIPKFNPKNPTHKRLAEISKECHRLKEEYYKLKVEGNSEEIEKLEREIEKLERENDELVKQLFEIKP